MKKVSCDVAVVGAGLAGLTTAHLLGERDVLVLEAEPRVGGRAMSYRPVDGRRVAVGGSMWFDADAGSPETRLLEKLGVPPRPVHADAEPGLCCGSDVIRYTADVDELAERLRFSGDAATDFRAAWQNVRTAHRTLRDPARRDDAAVELMSVTAADWLGDVHWEVREFYSRLLQAEMHLLLEETSAFFFIFSLPPFGGGAEEWGGSLIKVPGGGDRPTVGEALAASLREPPITNAMVRSVQDLGDRCEIAYLRDGEDVIVDAAKVVVATPSSTVARIVRGLPAWKLAAITALRPSCVVGVHLLGDVSQPVPWDDISFAWALDKSFGMLLRPEDEASLVRLSASGAPGMLYADRTDQLATTVFERDLFDLFPTARDLQIDGHLVTRFFHPATMPRFGNERYAEELIKPVGRLHFAGDYTGFEMPEEGAGYDGGWGKTSSIGLHAAMRSGRRVAAELA